MKHNFFENKVAIVTGASSGIGMATAKLLAAQGAKVVLAARSADKLEAIVQDLRAQGIPADHLLAVGTDVSREADCRRLVEQTVAAFGRIDILVNNAGVSMRAAFKDVDLEVLRRLMDTNFWGCVQCTKYALPYLLQSKGSVVGVTSIAGYVGLPCRTGYSSSKFALNGFLETLRTEHLYDGLHVMTFAPNFTASNVRLAALTADGTPQGKTPRAENKMMTAERCAFLMLRGIRQRRNQMVLTPLGKFTVNVFRVLLPGLTRRTEYRMMASEPDSPLAKH